MGEKGNQVDPMPLREPRSTTELSFNATVEVQNLTREQNRSHGHLSVKGVIIGSPWHLHLTYPNGVQG